MLWLKRIIPLLFIIVVLLLAIDIIVKNQTDIILDLVVFEFDTTVGKAIVSSLALSLILVVIATVPLVISYKIRLKRLQNRLLNSHEKSGSLEKKLT